MSKIPPANSRKEAINEGVSVFIGNPCKADNSTLRSTANGQCIECQRRKQRDYRAMRKSMKKHNNNHNEFIVFPKVDWRSAMQGVRYDLH